LARRWSRDFRGGLNSAVAEPSARASGRSQLGEQPSASTADASNVRPRRSCTTASTRGTGPSTRPMGMAAAPAPAAIAAAADGRRATAGVGAPTGSRAALVVAGAQVGPLRPSDFSNRCCAFVVRISGVMSVVIVGCIGAAKGRSAGAASGASEGGWRVFTSRGGRASASAGSGSEPTKPWGGDERSGGGGRSFSRGPPPAPSGGRRSAAEVGCRISRGFWPQDAKLRAAGTRDARWRPRPPVAAFDVLS